MKYKFKSKLTTFITCLASLSGLSVGKATQQNTLGENQLLSITEYLLYIAHTLSSSNILIISSQEPLIVDIISVLQKILLRFDKLNNLLRRSRLGSESQICLTPHSTFFIINHIQIVKRVKPTIINYIDLNVEENIFQIYSIKPSK